MREANSADPGRGADRDPRPSPTECLELVGRALVLADLGDPESFAGIVSAAEALAAACGVPAAGDDADPVLAGFIDLATALWHGESADPLADLESLGAAFDPLRRLAASAEEGGGRVAGVSSEPEGAGRAAAAVPGEMPLAEDEELLRDFVARSVEHLESADERMLLLEKDPHDTEALNGVFRALHTIKGMAGFLGLAEIEQAAHEAEGVLEAPRAGEGPLDRAGFERLFAAVDAMRSRVATLGASAGRATRGTRRTRARTGTRAQATAPSRATASVRVDEERLDRLLDTIGELVIAESVLSGSARARAGEFDPLDAQLSRLDKITRELQEMATSLRMVPLRSTFLRVARLVRDLAVREDKDVDLVVSGEDTELDKLVVDRVYDPLVHIIRNAVSHGVESPGERESAGKPRVATIALRAYHGGGAIHIEIEDDGRGFDLGAIERQARERGLVAGDDAPSERELVDLVFEPGFSTAREVTDVSGRGVGMDVVRRTVESLRGQIDVRTRPGSGTRVSIRLPLTLAIIDGMVVRSGDSRYIIPTLSIERSLRPSAGQVTHVLGRGEALEVGDALVPLLRLGTLLESEGAVEDPTEGIVVIVGENGDRTGLLACEILGQQQIVIKPLSEALQGIAGIAGGAIMADGRVGLIVDVGELVQLARA